MKANGRVFALVVVVGLVRQPAHAAPIFTGLGAAPSGTGYTVAAVSGDGSTVVGTAFGRPVPSDSDTPPYPPISSDAFHEAFRWTPVGGWQFLGDFPHHFIWNEDGTVGSAVSADGSTIVGYGHPAFELAPYRWTPGSGIQPLDEAASGDPFAATGVSADGRVVVGVMASGGASQTFRWTAGSGLQIILGDASRATGVSADGSTVIGWGMGPFTIGVFGGFRWTEAGGVENLARLTPCGDGCFHEEDDFVPTAVSADGSVVVGGTYRWTHESGPVSVGMEADGVSADGNVVVGRFASGGASIWDPVHGARDLAELLASQYGLDLTGWSLGTAVGVSSDGRTIVGNGTNPAGQPEGWIAFIPEPSTALLVAIGLATLKGARRRQPRAARYATHPSSVASFS